VWLDAGWEEVMRWAREWAKEGVELDPKKLFSPEDPGRPFLPRRRVVDRLLGVGSRER
jgi:hypothetical protein